MTKEKRERLKRTLSRLWDAVLDEPVPGSFSELIEQLNRKEANNGRN